MGTFRHPSDCLLFPYPTDQRVQACRPLFILLIQFGHADWFRLGFTFAAPDDIGNRQSLGGVVGSDKHCNECGHGRSMIFTNEPSTKRAGRAGFLFTMPAFHDALLFCFQNIRDDFLQRHRPFVVRVAEREQVFTGVFSHIER